MQQKRPWVKLLISSLLAALLFAVMQYGLPFLSSPVPPVGNLVSPFDGFYQNMDDDYWDQDIDLPALRAPVEVLYDERLVPHVYASSRADLFYVQGYLQAQHRLFQLDLTSRSAEGSLSELLGTRTLEFDRIRKRYGPEKIINKMVQGAAQDPKLNEVMTRFSEGVNAYINSLDPGDYPVEYKLFGAAPAQWSPKRTAYIALSMAYDLNHRNYDIASTNTRNLLGPDAFEELFPARSKNFEPIIPRGTEFNQSDSALIRAAEQMQLELGGVLSLNLDGKNYVEPEAGIGSNNWAVAPERTASGVAYLANDPHLGLTLPSIWFETELHTGDYHVHGVSLPGAPGITIGFNEKAAWGVTNVGHDMLDWHKIEYLNPDQTTYRGRDGQEKDIEYRVERLKVFGEEDVLDTVAVTEFGPIVHTDPEDYRYGLALEWLTLNQDNSELFGALIEFNEAETVDDFLQASAKFRWPAQNTLFANKRGDIAMRISGVLPRRLPGEGRFVMAPGQQEAHGVFPDDINPYSVNPPQGYLASSNQPSTDIDFPYYYQSENFDEFRSRRSNQLLRRDTVNPKLLTIDDMKAGQLDNYSIKAEELTPLLLEYVKHDKLNLTERGQVDVLGAWNYEYDKHAFAPVIFDLWAEELERQTWDEIVSERENAPVMQPRDWRLIELLEDDPFNRWFDVRSTSERESASDVVTSSLQAVSARIDSLSKIDSFGYENFRHSHINHLARLPAFSRNFVSVSGTHDALNSQRGGVGPSWRMIVELTPEISAHVVYPGGQSGHVGNPHYEDMIDAWAAGEYYKVKLRPSVEQSREAGLSTVVFTP